MPATYLTSSVGPDQPIDNWLSWSKKDYEKIKDDDTFVAALLGINRSGDIQTMYKPIPVVNENGTTVAIVGNNSQWKSNPSFSYVDANNLGSIILIENLENIPLEIRPSESIPKTYLASTTWSDSNNIAICLIPILAPIFFGQESIEGSVFDDDFVDKMKAISEKHGKWADLMVEFYNQQEETTSDLEKIIDRIKNPRRSNAPDPETFTSPGFKTFDTPEPPYTCIYQLSNPSKWQSYQEILSAYFISNPSPIRRSSRVTIQTPIDQDDKEDGEEDRENVNALPATPNQNQAQQQQQNQQQMPPWWLSAQAPPFLTQQSQNIVVESRADKAREQEAKLNTNMLSLFLIGVKTDWEDGKIISTLLPMNTTEYKNILAQPSSVRPTQAANILQTVFTTSPDSLEQRFSPLFSMLSMEFFPKNLVTAWLNANFQRSNLESLLFESNAITILTFVSQNDSAKLLASRTSEENARNEWALEMSEAHRTKAKTTIEGLGKIESMQCIVRIAANVCGFVRAFFDVEKGMQPFIYQLCIKTIDCITQQEFTRWYNANKSRMPHLPYYFLNMLQHVFAQQAKFSANSLNTNKVEHGDNGSTLITKVLDQTVKYSVRFFKRISDHVAEDTVPSSIPRFTPAHAHPSNQIATITTSIAMATISQDYSKKKPDDSPPGTPSKERRNKKARGLKPTGGTDQIKLGLFHSKEGIKPEDLFPSGLESTPCAFFCFQNKKCTRPRSSCPRPHNVKWDAIKPDDQAKILKHFSDTGNGWLDAETFNKHKIEIPKNYAFLLGDASGPKAKST